MIGGRGDLMALDLLLRSVRFRPRASLGAEVLGRWHRGERLHDSRPDRPRRLLRVAAITTLLPLGFWAFWLVALRPVRALTVDTCCQDLDGGGLPDDGLLVVSELGTRVKRLAIYEDRDGSGTLTFGDAIRFERVGPPALQAPLAPGSRTTEFCCLDYDGGGPSDDALVVVGNPPDQVSLAGIYERFSSPGRPVPIR